jgi:chromosome segregation ATPase
MTNDNNRIKGLVSAADEDPTAELETIGDAGGYEVIDDDLEVDAHTFDYENLVEIAEAPTDRIASLKRCIRQRDECIDRLQFDIERLRSRWTGLDKEIKVREKLTNNVNAELRKTRNELAAMQRKLCEDQFRTDSLSARIAEQDNVARDAGELIESLRSSLLSREQRINEFESRDNEMAGQLTALTAKLKEFDRRIEPSVLEERESHYQQQLAGLQAQLDSLMAIEPAREEERRLNDSRLTEASSALQELTARVGDLSEQLANRHALLQQQAAEIDGLRKQLDAATDQLQQGRRSASDMTAGASADLTATDADRAVLSAAQSGQLVTDRQEIRELRSKLSNLEEYADSLRIKLQDRICTSEETTIAKEQAEAALARACQTIAELTGHLELERLQTAAQQQKITDMQVDFEAEVREIRFELGAAQQTIVDHETVNEQLTSDLIDNQSFRQALESQLEKAAQASTARIRALQQKARRLEHQQDEDRNKISNKDGAIAALLSELANRTATVDKGAVVNRVVQRAADDFSDERHEDRTAGDRVTRLLVGSFDGQELRFPLFKDRLTIGRTVHNDIQLKAQYISRRHALIVTENDRTRIVDWGSRNGIAVNRRQVTEHVLKSGDIVTIGTADFRYEERPKR